MKTWMFVVIILVVVFVVVPLIYFGIIAKSVSNVADSAVKNDPWKGTTFQGPPKTTIELLGYNPKYNTGEIAI